MGQVVSLKHIGDGIALITMQDEESRNTFSQALKEGIMEVFAQVNNSEEYKVVILTGYANYFCCGGTKEELFDIYKGDLNFNRLIFFTTPLECKVPVISAMQGHGIGGGLVFGLYSDFTVLGKENIYTTNFMKYGFTPGMGGTMMVPLRFGATLGNEMLFSARNYRGQELKERGVPVKVVPKAEVMDEALTLAKSLAEKPRLSLVTLKGHLTKDIKAKLPQIIDEEVEMHDITFHHPEVANRIEQFFGN